MGKIKTNKKTRIHLKPLGAAAEDVNNKKDISDSVQNSDFDKLSKTVTDVNLPDLNNNPFSGLKISNDFLQAKLTSIPLIKPDIKDVSEDVLNEPKIVRKKDKMKQRRENFLKKLEVAHRSRKPIKKVAKKPHQNKTAVVGDLSFMKLALPQIKQEDNERKPKKLSRRQKRRLKRLNKSSPLGSTIDTASEQSTRPLSNKQKHKHIINEIGKFKDMLKKQSPPISKSSREVIAENLLRRNLT